MDDEKFVFQHWLDKETQEKHKEFKRIVRKLKLKWRSSVLNHDSSINQPKPRGAKLLRRHYR